MSIPNETHDAANTIELGPIIGDAGSDLFQPTVKTNDHTTDESQEQEQGLQDGDEIASDKKAGNGSRMVGDEANSTSLEAIQPEEPSSSPRLSLQPTRSGVETADRREKQSSEQKGSNAMLNLPPPLPFDLKVSNLWVGVPHSGPSR